MYFLEKGIRILKIVLFYKVLRFFNNLPGEIVVNGWKPLYRLYVLKELEDKETISTLCVKWC